MRVRARGSTRTSPPSQRFLTHQGPHPTPRLAGTLWTGLNQSTPAQSQAFPAPCCPSALGLYLGLRVPLGGVKSFPTLTPPQHF